MLPVSLAGIPDELKQVNQWCLWKNSARDGSPTKKPFQARGGLPAKSDDPKTWASFEAAFSKYSDPRSQWHGLGFVFAENDPFCGIDLDGCRNPETGEIAEWATTIIEDFATYCEVSPSETGVKLWVRGRWPFDGHKQILTDATKVCEKTPAIEVYDSLRYFAVTGKPVSEIGLPVAIGDRQPQLDRLRERYWPASSTATAQPSRKGKPLTTATTSAPLSDRAKIIDRAAAYLAKVPPAISGQGGSDATIRAACELFRFGLTDGEARSVFDEFNARCVPPWSESEIAHKLEDARDKVIQSGEFGSRITEERSSRSTAKPKSKSKSNNSSAKPNTKSTEITFDILGKLQNVQAEGPRRWRATCSVVHENNENSLTITCGKDGNAVIECSAGCSRVSVMLACKAMACDIHAKRVAINNGKPDDANQSSADEQPEPNESPADPHRLARLFVSENTFADVPTIKIWRGVWYRWHDGYYDPLDQDEMRCRVVASIKSEFDLINVEQLKNWQKKSDEEKEEEEPPKVIPVTVTMIGSVMQALRSLCLLPASIEAPSLLTIADDTKNQTITGTPAKHLVALRNGVLDLRKFLADADDVLEPHSPTLFTLAALPIEFNAEAECPLWRAFVARNLADDDRADMLQEWFGICATFNNSFQSFLMLQGEGSNGKSVICSVLTAFLGLHNVSHVPLECFGETFHLSGTVGKLANIVSEIGEVEKANEGTLKSYTSGDRMTFNRKNLPLFEAVPTARLVMSTNGLPRFADRSNGVWRRMLLLPLDVVIGADERVAGMDSVEWWSDKPAELSGILLWALAGLARLMQNRKFTKPEAMVAGMAEYQLECFPARKFLTDTYEENEFGEVSTHEVYQLYRKWCEENGHKKPQASNSFGKEIKKVFPKANSKRWVLRHDGKRGPGYTGIEVAEPQVMTPETDEEKAKKLSELF